MVKVVRKEVLPDEIRERRQQVRDLWAQFPTIPKLLQDCFPEEWERVRRCRFSYRVYQNPVVENEYKASPISCHRIPFCIPCTTVHNHSYAMEWVNRFYQATPPGKPLRVYHVVFTARLATDGSGWGWKARDRLDDFFTFGQKCLRGVFREHGLGGVKSYHDFGEQPFVKSHPHLDVLVNAYALRDNHSKWIAMPSPELRYGGRARIDEVTQRYARSFDLLADPSDFDVRPAEGRGPVYKVAKYSLRSMVDLRKIIYYRKERRVEFVPQDAPKRGRASLDGFLSWLEEYSRRYGHFGLTRDERPIRLHRPFGFFNPTVWRRAQQTFGGSVPDHERDCKCRECVDWRQVMDEDFGQYASPDTGLVA